MTIEINELLTILEQQSNVLQNLINLAESQVEILKVNNIEELKRHTVLQEEQGRKLALLERDRGVLLVKYQNQYQITITNITDLASHLSPEDLQKLTNISEKILIKHERLHTAQELNKLLLKQGLSYSKKMLKNILGEDNGVYGKSGTKENSKHQLMIDKSV
ncbi:FlgN protein [Desulfonispora thiosulfatigenes DSM 11270]|uniref:FlgN protein n=1 Tax=Desulfonispora thiosulfatigenes DSM 11270 TaxID=656914 RepID=A0A1W1UP79_DESTI|nr:flagellar export chaperone FlgN [Desulfonispora thiosulfatigenes]SMB82833.1 FlgN protein [Desulfonispora thiosulfatigenes DSM 11270]